jgi:peptidoglycan-associated lipoprotein
MNRHLTFVTVAAAIVLSACSSTPDGVQNPAQVEDRSGAKGSVIAPPATGVNVNPSGATSLGGSAIAPPINATTSTGGRGDPALRDPKSLLSQRSIYFDYDGFVVAPDYKALIEAHARYLVANRGMRMRIEGNTDERGSREYNLALGQKRADGVRRSLTVLGVNDGQIETVSFGEEKPRSEGSAEQALRENRRADIVYAGE